MKNRLSDLNNHLFAQMERLSDESLSKEEIEREVKRAKSIVDVSDQITRFADLSIQGAKLVATHGPHLRNDLPMLGRPASITATSAEGSK